LGGAFNIGLIGNVRKKKIAMRPNANGGYHYQFWD
jgi:hypothetical protein